MLTYFKLQTITVKRGCLVVYYNNKFFLEWNGTYLMCRYGKQREQAIGKQRQEDWGCCLQHLFLQWLQLFREIWGQLHYTTGLHGPQDTLQQNSWTKNQKHQGGEEGKIDFYVCICFDANLGINRNIKIKQSFIKYIYFGSICCYWFDWYMSSVSKKGSKNSPTQ